MSIHQTEAKELYLKQPERESEELRESEQIE